MSTQLFPVGGSPADVDADAVVIGLVSAESDAPPRLAPGADELDAAFEGQLAELLAVAGATGKADEVVKLPTRGALRAPLLVAVGLGKGTRRAGCAPSRSDGRPVPPRGRSRAPTTRSARSVARIGRRSRPPRRAACSARTRSRPTAPTATARHRWPGSRWSPTPPTRTRCSARPPRWARRCAPPATWSTPRPTTSTPRRSPPGPASWPRPRGSRSRCSTTPPSPRPGSAACSGWVRARRASRGWCGCAGPVGRRRGRRSRSWARASRSTRAASRSSPRRTWTT